jgi:hypothetical protein
MAQPPQACAPCPAHYAVLQGASSVLYWPPLPGAPRGVPPPGASFWATCNSAAAHKRCVVSESGKRASVALAYNKPECSGL